MSATNNRTGHYKTIRQTCYIANIAYLVIRLFYLIFFIITQVYPLVWLTAGTMVFYALCFFLIKRKQYYPYALLCGNEYFALVSVTTVMLGFSSGFHFYLIALCVVSFFTTYFSKTKNIKGSIVWVGLSLIIYLVLFFITEFNNPYYVMEKWLEITLFTTHAIVVFGIIATYLLVFVKYALSLEKRIINESRTDELTQISNRYGLYDYFDQTEDKSTKVLALFDIDDFKVINDKYGHTAGYFILKRVAEITTNVLDGSFVCRYGGEEFVVVFDKDEQSSIIDRLEVLRKSIAEETFEFEGTKIHLTITMGAINYLKDTSLEKWVELADEKMYSGKKSGKNKTVI